MHSGSHSSSRRRGVWPVSSSRLVTGLSVPIFQLHFFSWRISRAAAKRSLPVEAAGPRESHREMQRRGQLGGLEAHAAGVVHGQRARFQPLRRDADLTHQLQGLAVGADHDVLAVVDLPAVLLHHPRPPAHHPRGFEHRHPHIGARQRDCAGKPA